MSALLPQIGTPGVRDTENPCEDFAPDGERTGSCAPDGHYMCLKCRHINLAEWDLLKGDPSDMIAAIRRITVTRLEPA